MSTRTIGQTCVVCSGQKWIAGERCPGCEGTGRAYYYGHDEKPGISRGLKRIIILAALAAVGYGLWVLHGRF